MLSNVVKTLAILLGLLVLQCTAVVPEAGVGEDEFEWVEREVLVLTGPEVIVLPQGKTEAPLEEVQAPQEVLDVLYAIEVQLVRRAMPEFDPADTLRISPHGDTARLPDFSNLFALRLPAGADRDHAVFLLEQLPQVIHAEKNQKAEPDVLR